jgi:hypothetical protein
MDVGLSQTMPSVKVALATRTIPLREYWITTGAALLFDADTDYPRALHRMERDYPQMGSDQLRSLSIVRACIEAGAPEHMKYKKPRREPRMHFKRRRNDVRQELLPAR